MSTLAEIAQAAAETLDAWGNGKPHTADAVNQLIEGPLSDYPMCVALKDRGEFAILGAAYSEWCGGGRPLTEEYDIAKQLGHMRMGLIYARKKNVRIKKEEAETLSRFCLCIAQQALTAGP